MTALTILPQGRVRCGEQGFIPLDQTTQLMQYETVISAPIVASDAAAGMFAWQNTSNMPFLVTSANVVIETAPTVPTIGFDLGIASGLSSSNALLSATLVTTGAFASQQPRTATVASANQLVAAGQWITLSRTAGATAGARGWVFIKGIYLGTVDDASLGQGAGLCPTGRVGVPDQKGFMAYASTTGYPCAPYVVEAPITPSDTAGGLFAWANPFPFPVLVEDLTVNVQTGSTGASTFSFGVAANDTTLSSTLLSGTNGQTVQTIASSEPLAATSTTAARLVGAGQWITGSRASGATAGIVGRVHLSVLPLGTVIN